MEPLEDCLIFLLAKANQHLQQQVKRRLAPYGITSAQYAVLRVLWEQDGVTGGEISDRTRIDCATLTGVIDRLETAGLAERIAHPSDRRANRIKLTRAGKALKTPIGHEIRALNAEVLGVIGPRNEHAVRGFLERLDLTDAAPTSTGKEAA